MIYELTEKLEEALKYIQDFENPDILRAACYEERENVMSWLIISIIELGNGNFEAAGKSLKIAMGESGASLKEKFPVISELAYFCRRYLGEELYNTISEFLDGITDYSSIGKKDKEIVERLKVLASRN